MSTPTHVATPLPLTQCRTITCKTRSRTTTMQDAERALTSNIHNDQSIKNKKGNRYGLMHVLADKQQQLVSRFSCFREGFLYGVWGCVPHKIWVRTRSMYVQQKNETLNPSATTAVMMSEGTKRQKN